MSQWQKQTHSVPTSTNTLWLWNPLLHPFILTTLSSLTACSMYLLVSVGWLYLKWCWGVWHRSTHKKATSTEWSPQLGFLGGWEQVTFILDLLQEPTHGLWLGSMSFSTAEHMNCQISIQRWHFMKLQMLFGLIKIKCKSSHGPIRIE